MSNLVMYLSELSFLTFSILQTSFNGIVLGYTSNNFLGDCFQNNNISGYILLFDRSFVDCVRECKRRPRCQTVRYDRRILVCVLYSSILTNVQGGGCFQMTRNEFQTQIALEGKCEEYYLKCNRNEMCSLTNPTKEPYCEISDCGVGPPSILHDVVIHYVDNNKGSTARLKCKDYVRFSEGSGHAVCTNQGKWQVDLNCSVPLDCKELYDKYDVRESGPHYISPDKTSGILANCDMTTEGGGWTIIQRRINPDLDFYKSWSEYKTGFGNISSNFWLGNDALHALTATPNTLRFVLTDFSNNVKYADYRNVEVKDEQDYYRLNFEEYLGGSAGNALKGSESKYWAYGMQFSTHDMDNDNLDSVNCGSYMKGGWWYNSCTTSNLNGVYCESSDRHNCMTWSESDDYSELRVGHKETVIMIRRTV